MLFWKWAELCATSSLRRKSGECWWVAVANRVSLLCWFVFDATSLQVLRCQSWCSCLFSCYFEAVSGLWYRNTNIGREWAKPKGEFGIQICELLGFICSIVLRPTSRWEWKLHLWLCLIQSRLFSFPFRKSGVLAYDWRSYHQMIQLWGPPGPILHAGYYPVCGKGMESRCRMNRKVAQNRLRWTPSPSFEHPLKYLIGLNFTFVSFSQLLVLCILVPRFLVFVPVGGGFFFFWRTTRIYSTDRHDPACDMR